MFAAAILSTVPTAANAATVARPAVGTIRYQAGENERNVLTVSKEGGDYVFEDTGELMAPGTGPVPMVGRCNGPTPVGNRVLCPATGVVEIEVVLVEGMDQLGVAANVDGSPPTPGLPRIMAEGGSDDDILTGGNGADSLSGGPGVDHLNGGGGNDRLDFPGVVNPDVDQTLGNDELDGGPGDDLLDGGPARAQQEHDTLSGGDGTDTADYSHRTARLNIDLDGSPNDGEGGENDNVDATVENVTGGSDNDSLAGSASPNTLDGRDGNDTVAGGGGVDTLYGRGGDDLLVGDDDDDILLGAGGSDTLRGRGGNDTLQGGAGTDALDGGDGNDRVDGAEPELVGADGADTLAGGPGADALSGDDGDDTIDGGVGPDDIRGGAGRDTVTYEDRAKGVTVTLNGRPDDGEDGEFDNVASDVEAVIGGKLDDTLTGDADINAFSGGAGEDLLTGGAGRDRLDGGKAGDLLQARDGDTDVVDCGNDNDLAIADARDDVRNCRTVDRGGRRTGSFGRWVVVRPVQGFALQLPGGSRLYPLTGTTTVPVRSTIDPQGRDVRLVTAATRAGGRLEISVAGGLFAVRQNARRSVTELRLRSLRRDSCPKSRTTRRRAPSAKTLRQLSVRIDKPKRRGRTKAKKAKQARAEVRGKHSAAVAEGTAWRTVERCDGTLTQVTTGTVRVRDLERNRTVLVRAGHSYLARPR